MLLLHTRPRPLLPAAAGRDARGPRVQRGVAATYFALLVVRLGRGLLAGERMRRCAKKAAAGPCSGARRVSERRLQLLSGSV